MKKTLLACALLAVIPGISTLPARAVVSPIETYPKVADVYRTIPTEFLPIDPGKRSAAVVTTESDLNFLRFRWNADGSDGWGDVKLLSDSREMETVYVGLTLNACPDGGCRGTLKMLRFRKGEWADVTSQLGPKLNLPDYARLIRQVEEIASVVKPDGSFPYAMRFWEGSELELVVKPAKTGESGHVIARFEWTGSGFEDPDRRD